MGEQVAARSNGDVAQLGEHLPCKQGVESSNLSVSTESRQNCFDSKKPRVAKRSGRNTENRAAISRSNLRSKLYGTLKTEH